MTQATFRIAACAAAFVLTSALTPAHAQVKEAPAPTQAQAKEIPTIETGRTIRTASQVNFVTGGIGDDERQLIEAAYGDYNVHITSASVSGAFVEDTQVVIRNAAGAEELHVEAGPLLYVQLPVGRYTVEATHGAEVQKRKLTVAKNTKAGRVHFGWKVPEVLAE